MAGSPSGIAFSRVNPRQVRDFAGATGKLGKTDAIDAGVILGFAAVMQPAAALPAPNVGAGSMQRSSTSRRALLFCRITP